MPISVVVALSALVVLGLIGLAFVLISLPKKATKRNQFELPLPSVPNVEPRTHSSGQFAGVGRG